MSFSFVWLSQNSSDISSHQNIQNVLQLKNMFQIVTQGRPICIIRSDILSSCLSIKSKSRQMIVIWQIAADLEL